MKPLPLVAEGGPRATQVASITAALAVGQHVAAKAVREGLFLSSFSASALPKAMLVAAVLAVPAVLVIARAMAKVGPATLVPRMFVVSALASLAEWLTLPALPRIVAAVLYLHVAVGGAVVVSAFWSLVNECLDAHSLKQSIGRIAAGATLGGLVGGLAMERVAHWLDARSALLVVAAMSLGASPARGGLGRHGPRVATR